MNQELQKNKPLVSIVMCAYNGMPYIKDAVESIFQQTYEHWELIITDDGSNDGTREWLRTLEGNTKVRLFFQENNLGYVANKNFGHLQAKGEYITQLDNDDTSSPDRLQVQMDAILQHPGVKISACGYTRIDAEGRPLGTESEGSDGLITQREGWEYPFWYPSLLVHKSVFETIGYFDLYFAGAFGDDMYWTEKARLKFPIWHCAAPLYHYRYIASSITNVLNNERKLILKPILEELFRQRLVNGTDWLEEGNKEALAQFEAQLLRNSKYMGEQYRIWAAKAIDRKNKEKSTQLIAKAFKTYPWSMGNLVTLLYYLRTFGFTGLSLLKQ